MVKKKQNKNHKSKRRKCDCGRSEGDARAAIFKPSRSDPLGKRDRSSKGTRPKACNNGLRDANSCDAPADKTKTTPRDKSEKLLHPALDFSGEEERASDNDPSAGSPTETLLRLLLSPSDRVRASSRPTVPALARQTETNPRPSLNRSIDSSDGRCVQRAGT